MPTPSRRSFLANSSLALAGLGLGIGRVAYGLPVSVPMRSRNPVATMLPEIVDPDALRALALAGIEAAQKAGADYADIRTSDSRRWRIDWGMPLLQPLPQSDMSLLYGYGLRVRVGGAWGFAYGVDPTIDGVARAARGAVATARGMAKFASAPPVMASAPVVRGEWASPFEIDPFSISPDAHAKLLGAFIDAAERVPGGGVRELQFVWSSETRVFASSEGSLVTQYFKRSAPNIEVGTRNPLRDHGVGFRVPGVSPVSAGFESLVGTALQDRIKATTEETIQFNSYPDAYADVGRFEAVFDGMSMAAVMGSTLVQALDLERALGNDADGAGTSFLAPTPEVLGQPLFSPELTATADRDLPHFGAVKWDDEGATGASFPIIQNGRVVDYFTTRTTVPTLATWYAKTGKSLQSRGSAVSWAATTSPTGAASHVTVAPSTTGPTLDALIRSIGNGILVRGLRGGWDVSSDQQLTGCLCTPALLFEIKKGAITRRLQSGAVSFRTTNFWKNITAMGNASTAQGCTHVDWRGETFAKAIQHVVAPAARIASVDMLQIGRSL